MKALVVTVGGLNLSYLGCYGNDWVETPQFDQLASESVVFDEHYADCPDPAGARRSWRTGCYFLPDFPASGCSQAPSEVPSDFVRLLRDRRIHTVLIQNPPLGSAADFSSDWDRVCNVSDPGDGNFSQPLFARALEEIGTLRASDRWLVWLDCGAIFDPSPRFADVGNDESFQEMQNGYAEVVMRLDAGLGELLLELASGKMLDDILLLVTGDRGVPVGEHGVIGGHRPWLYEELVHVPLLVRLPRRDEAGRRVLALTQTVDLMPTLLEFFGGEKVCIHGRSLWPLLRGEVEQIRSYACSGLEIGAAAEWRLQTPQWAVLVPLRIPPADPPRGPQLFVKPDDRWEVNDLYHNNPDLADQLERTVRAFASAVKQPGALTLPPLLTDDAKDI